MDYRACIKIDAQGKADVRERQVKYCDEDANDVEPTPIPIGTEKKLSNPKNSHLDENLAYEEDGEGDLEYSPHLCVGLDIRAEASDNGTDEDHKGRNHIQQEEEGGILLVVLLFFSPGSLGLRSCGFWARLWT